MGARLAESAKPEDSAGQRILRDGRNCGDCRAPLPEPPQGTAGRSADAYCPRCPRGSVPSEICPSCGSEVCVHCGAITESPSEIGYG